MVMLPLSADEWLEAVGKREPMVLEKEDRRLVREWLGRPETLEVWRRLVQIVEGQEHQLRTLNMMVPEQAAEALRIQGSRRTLLVLAETMLEAANVAS